ncbi:HNH endonuclease [Shinella zoogloeoides]|uniref:HNH endonuclease n=1 Tax=Shinella zoogloeoides TaxID=352475 RepID=UPI0028AADB51|nr:HNH endonuclease [Shinella zoogloeoides]
MSITHERLHELLTYDPETGIFRWKVDRNQNVKAGSIAGAPDSSGYIQVRVDGRKYQANRLAWLYMTGEWPSEQVDHRDRDRANNRWANLREATHAENCRNRRRRSDNKSGFPGVKITRNGTYEATIGIDGEKVYLGTYSTLHEALNVRRFAEKDIHGEFARA